MSNHVFVVSEWLPKKNCEQEFWKQCKKLMAATAAEKGCIKAHATKQIAHPGSLGKSKYTVVLLQEYANIEAFDEHCNADHVKNFFKKYIDDEKTSIVAEWQCRLFGAVE